MNAADAAPRYDLAWVETHYDGYGMREWGRWDQSPEEQVKLFIHTHYLKKHVKAGDRVLEMGAGPGRFTAVLAERGARVTVADISQGQLDANRIKAKELGFLSAVEDWVKADVCSLPMCADGEFDAVLCYGGVLSYVFERRSEAMSELLRVAKPRAPVLLSVMSLWGTVHAMLQGVLNVPAGQNASIIETGDLHPDTFPACNQRAHLFRAEELRRFLNEFMVDILDMSASNSVSASYGDRLSACTRDEGSWDELLQMELKASREPGCLDMGTHLLAAVVKRQGQVHATAGGG